MPREMTRREMLSLALASPLLAAAPHGELAQQGKSLGLDIRFLMDASSAVVPLGDSAGIKHVKLVREWKGPVVPLAFDQSGTASSENQRSSAL